MRALLSIVIIGTALAGSPMARQQRDTAPQPPGTASIAGVVIDAESKAPIRHAIVVLTSSETWSQINSDASGAFRFDRLVAGRYEMTVTAPRYVPVNPRLNDAPPVRIGVASGQVLTGLTIAMTRGAIVSGVLSTSSGQPFPNVTVSLWRWSVASTSGDRTLALASMGQTDERGAYRISGVAPGEYFVKSNGESMWGGLRGDGTIEEAPQLTHAEVETARRGATRDERSPVAAGTPARRLMYADTFYPGTPRVADAVSMTLAAGEERAGLDFAMQSVTANTIRGRVVPQGGLSSGRGTVHVFPRSMGQTPLRSFPLVSSENDGSFTVSALFPGEYLLSAQTYVAPRPGAPAEGSSPLEVWTGSAVVNVVDGTDVTDVVITTTPGVTLSGSVRFDGAAPTPAQLALLRIRLKAVLAAGEISVGAPASTVDASGRFSVSSVTQGKYVAEFFASGSGSETWQRWWLKSAIVNGRDYSDVPADLGTADIKDLVLTLSDRTTLLSGAVKGPDGIPGAGSVVVFAVDPVHWWRDSRRVTAAALGAGGTFRIPRLPPGEYFIAPVERSLPPQLGEPSFLQTLIASAVRVTLGEGEQKVVDVPVR